MFWDRISPLYDLFENVYNHRVYAGTGRKVAEFIDSTDFVLECACGTGAITVCIAEKCRKLVATDFATGMLRQAARKCRKYGNVKFKRADITNIKCRSDRFDKVVAGNVIHLLPDPGKALAELERVAKPDGKIIIPTYINMSKSSAGLAVKFVELLGADFKKQFDLDSYKAFFEEMGYQDVEYHVVDGRMPCAIAVITKEDVRKNLETERLILRRWEETDAGDLFRYASDPDVGPIAGWPAHQSIGESLEVIKNVLNGKEAYAICLKEDGKAIGAIELKLNGHTDMTDRDDECDLGYWLGKPFWGRGIMPEAVREMLRHAFEDCGMQKVWCGYYEGNEKSRRVQEKCHFKYQWKSEDVDVPLMHEKRTGHVNLMTKEDWNGIK